MLLENKIKIDDSYIFIAENTMILSHKISY